MASKAMAWTGRYWSTLAMLGVAMFSLLVLRSVVKRQAERRRRAPPRQPRRPDACTPTSRKPAATDSDEEPEDDRPRLRLKKGKSLKDDLVEIVREDPDAAADILRSWIGKAG